MAFDRKPWERQITNREKAQAIVPHIVSIICSIILGYFLLPFMLNNPDRNYEEGVQLNCWVKRSYKHTSDPGYRIYEIHPHGT